MGVNTPRPPLDAMGVDVRVGDTVSTGTGPHVWSTLDPGQRKTISIMNACKLVGVSRRTIYNWMASKKISYVRTAGGSVRIFVDTLFHE